MTLRPFALVRTREQWLSAPAALREHIMVDEEERVMLEWHEIARSDLPGAVVVPAGMAFDGECRLYRALRTEGRVLRMRWQPAEGPEHYELAPVDLFGDNEIAIAGDFSPSPAAQPLNEPCALAVDDNDRLFIAECAARRVLVYDLWSRVLVRAVLTDAEPLDLTAAGARVFVLMRGAATLLELTARERARRINLPADVGQVARLAVAPNGTFALLVDAATAQPRVLLLRYLDQPLAEAPTLEVAHELAIAHAADIEFDDAGILYVARRAGESVLRFGAAELTPITPLRAPGYDGSGLVRTPEGRIAWWAAGGLSHGLQDRVRYESAASITTPRLDAEDYQTVWGRVFVDACLPRGTSIRIGFHTSDEGDDAPNTPLATPFELYARDTGAEQPWANLRSAETIVTLEAPIHAPPGRYLWMTLQLLSDTRATPTIASVRAETVAHAHLQRLPRTLSRQAEAAGFLHRYLASLDGVLTDLDARASLRHLLIDARTAPAELLPWLAGFVGLLLDERWSECAKRQVITEVAWLFRYRGTVPGLQRFLEICVGGPVILIEHFKLRGQGAALLGDTGPAFTSAVLGVGFRIGGSVGDTTSPTPMQGTLEDAFNTHAHRFTVIVPGTHTPDTLGIVTRVLEEHRPAHTIFDICTVDAGMRVGRGLHAGLSAIVGRTGGFRTLQIRNSLLGRDGIIGRPVPGVRVQSTRLQADGGVWGT